MMHVPMPLAAAAYNFSTGWRPNDLSVSANGDGRTIEIKVGVTLRSADDARAFAGMITSALVSIFDLYVGS